MAEQLESGAEHLAHVVEQGHAALQVGAVEHGPGVGGIGHLGGQVAEAGGRHHVGHGDLHLFVGREISVQLVSKCLDCITLCLNVGR